MGFQYMHIALCLLTVSVSLGDSENIKTEDCPKLECYYSSTNKTFSCPSAKCNKIPVDIIDYDVENLYLQNNNISKVPDLRNFPNIKIIDLASNNISSIEDWAFYSQDRMTLLTLAGNKLKTLKRQYFEGLDDLLYLYLNLNQLTTIKADYFPSDLMVLKRLDLTDNRIDTIEDRAFVNLAALKYLHLQNNNLTDIRNLQFEGLDALDVLELSKNKIKVIRNDTFFGTSYVRFLDLGFNHISRIEPMAFDDLEFLETLNLAGNKIVSLDSRVLHVGLLSLKALHLDQNPIKFLDAGQMPAVVDNITMTSMKMLEYIGENAFANIDGLKVLRVSGCPSLTDISPMAFGGKESIVPRLDLSDNHLWSLDRDLLNWEKVERLDLSGNYWHCDCHLQWMKEVHMPTERVRQRIRCESPSNLKNKKISNIEKEEFQCFTFRYSEQLLVAVICLLTLIFVSGMVIFLYKCRVQVFPCWFAKPGKYIALYNVNETESMAMSMAYNQNGVERKNIVKNQSNGKPPPVNV